MQQDNVDHAREPMARQRTLLPTSDMPSSILPPRAEVQNECSQTLITHISFHAAQRDKSTLSLTLFEHYMRTDKHTHRAESRFSLRRRKNVSMDQLIRRNWSLPLIPLATPNYCYRINRAAQNFAYVNTNEAEQNFTHVNTNQSG